MDRRALIAALPLLAAAAPAMASGAKKEEKKGEGKEGKDVGQYVDLAAAAMPIVVSGQVVNYVFVVVRIVLTPSANASKLRAKEPYFRDALIKAAHRTPFTDDKDYAAVDVAKLQAAMLRDAIAIGGRENIKSVTVQSQTPKQRVGLPKPRSGAGEIRP